MDFLNSLGKMLYKTKYKIVPKNEITLRYKFLIEFADLLLELPNCVICFKDYWTHFNYRNIYTDKFIERSVQLNNLNRLKPYIFVICKKKTSNNFIQNNIKNPYLYFLEYDNKNDLLFKIATIFYDNNVYFYDDHDVIMISKNISLY
jgi:hypothetical protein